MTTISETNYEDLINLYTKFSNYINVEDTKSSSEAIKFLPTISYKLYNIILSIYVNQNICNQLNNSYELKEYTNFIFNSDNLELDDIINFKSYDDAYCIINIYQKSCTFQMYSFDLIKNIFEINKHNKFIFIPILLTKYKNNIGHACLLIINQQSKEIKFFDPNGITSLQNLDINITIVDDILEKYTLILNSIDNTTYSYIKQKIWLQENQVNNKITNLSKIVINDSVTNALIGSKGSCVVITIIMAHMLYLYNDYSIRKLIDTFNIMNYDEKGYFIKNYTQKIYDLLKQSDLIKQNNLIQQK